MTGAGAPGAAGIISCLLKASHIHLSLADADENAVGKYLHDDFTVIPKAMDPGYTDAVLKLCREKKIQLLLPLVTKELFVLSAERSRFEKEGIRVMISNEKEIQVANDKSACYTFLQKNGIPLPQFRIVHTSEDFIHAAFELGHPQKPFCFKPSISNGSRGVRIISDSINELDQLFNYKPYNLYITYTHALKILTSGRFPELLVSEYLPGDEYSVDCLANQGKAVLVVPRLRIKTMNGISIAGEFIKDEEIIAYCTKIISLLSLHGNIGIQLKKNSNGQALLLEINPRVQGTIVAGLGAGVNLPLLAVKQEMGIPVEPSEMEVKWGTKFSRYWSEVYY